MHSPHFHAETTYPGQLSGPMSGLDTQDAKIHTSDCSGELDACCFFNYGVQGQYTANDNGGFHQTTYSQTSTSFPSACSISDTRNFRCYKSSAQTDLPDLTRTKQEDMFVVAPLPPFSIPSSSNIYSCYNTNLLGDQSRYHYHHHHYEPQRQHHDKHQSYQDFTAMNTNNVKLQHDHSFVLPNSFKMQSTKAQSHHFPSKMSNRSRLSTTSQSPTNVRNVPEDSSNTTHRLTSHSTCEQTTLPNSPQLPEDKRNTHTPNSTNSSESKQAVSGKSEDTITLNSKPTMSYIALIAKAILESEQGRLSLGSIYNWIEKNYPFYKSKAQGWRNSVRHNLSLNYCFIKSGRCEDGKGNYWAIHPENLHDFMRGDFRQRRRSRRRGKKRDCSLGIAQAPNGYLQSPSMQLSTGMALHPSDMGSVLSPYTEAEKSAYRLDEALFRHRIGSPYVKMYQEGSAGSPTCRFPTTSPACGPNTQPSSSSLHWSQPYTGGCNQIMYPALSTTT